MIKIEDTLQNKYSKIISGIVKDAIGHLPREHTIGISKVKIVDEITLPKSNAAAAKAKLPGLYHPRQGPYMAWIELSLNSFIPLSEASYKRIMYRLSLRANTTSTLFALVGQHYFMTLRHSVKKPHIEAFIKDYTYKQLQTYRAHRYKFRYRLTKPIQPYLEKLVRSLNKKATR